MPQSKSNYDARLKSLKMNKLLAAIISSAIGIVLLFWPKITLRLVCRFVAIMILLMALLMLGMYLGQKRLDRGAASGVTLGTGVILLILGLWIFISPDKLAAMIPFIIGVIVFIDGIFNFIETIAVSHQNGQFPLGLLALSFLTILFGIILVSQPFGIAAIITQVIGIATLYNGISDFIIAMKIHPKAVNEATDTQTDDTMHE